MIELLCCKHLIRNILRYYRVRKLFLHLGRGQRILNVSKNNFSHPTYRDQEFFIEMSVLIYGDFKLPCSPLRTPAVIDKSTYKNYFIVYIVYYRFTSKNKYTLRKTHQK